MSGGNGVLWCSVMLVLSLGFLIVHSSLYRNMIWVAFGHARLKIFRVYFRANNMPHYNTRQLGDDLRCNDLASSASTWYDPLQRRSTVHPSQLVLPSKLAKSFTRDFNYIVCNTSLIISLNN